MLGGLFADAVQRIHGRINLDLDRIAFGWREGLVRGRDQVALEIIQQLTRLAQTTIRDMHKRAVSLARSRCRVCGGRRTAISRRP